MASLAVGTRSLYDWCADDGRVCFALPAQLVAPTGDAAAAPFMAINSALEVDLRGQANAELVGTRYVGAVSGQPDYFRAARRSPGGLAILALTATAGAAAKSCVVARLAEAYVTSTQSDIDVIATEYGVADIRATTLAERRRLIAALAEPSFRAALSEGELDVPAR
jgi:acyl-CoA hydrolase